MHRGINFQCATATGGDSNDSSVVNNSADLFKGVTVWPTHV